MLIFSFVFFELVIYIENREKSDFCIIDERAKIIDKNIHEIGASIFKNTNELLKYSFYILKNISRKSKNTFPKFWENIDPWK